MKRIVKYLFIAFLMGMSVSLSAQQENSPYYIPKYAVKTNLLYLGTTTLNLGGEFGIGEKTTLELTVNYNPWNFKDHKKIKHFMVQNEFRYWTCERFNGHFFGLHLFYGIYNFSGFNFLNLENKRYQGDAFGAGISYGYQWILSPRWNLEATIGAGYTYLDYEKYRCFSCEILEKKDHKHYIGLTKIGINLVYFLK